ncbi:MAG: hypothetical protein M1812_005112 [Candelaria pacifica]|nr:MAG: hypothetical protein M1812_005112 [Candelaria pacifica]
MSGPAALIVPAIKKHTATVIIVHGLGDSGAGWVGLAENWRRRGRFEEVSFVFPNAPSIPITVNFGTKIPGWNQMTHGSFGRLAHSSYKTTFDELAQAHDEVGILRSRDYFNSLIKAEMDKGIPSSRVVLGGFSQGGAMSLITGITCPNKLGGIFGLSCYLLMPGKVKDLVPEQNPNKDTPILMGHGDADPLVKHTWGQKTAEALKEWGWNVDFKTYRGLAHSADPKEIDDVEAYIAARLPPLEETSKPSK